MGAYKALVMVLAFAATVALQVAEAEICAGCPVNQDPAKFPVDKLSRALATAQVNDGPLKILNVKVQVVSGIMYTVTYESLSGKTCTASWIEAPWINQTPLNTEISCRAKRSLGGFENVDDSEIPDVEGFGNQIVNKESNGFRKMVVKVLEAQKQVVHGMIYKAKLLVKSTACRMEQVPEYTCMQKETAPREICSVSVFTTPYLSRGSPHFEVMDMECKNMLTESFLAAPAGHLTTGHDDKDQESAQSFAVYMINTEVNSLNYKGLYKVLNVGETMSAGGKLYTFDLELRDTDCTREDGLKSTKKCNFVTSTPDLKCTTKVWYFPWTGHRMIRYNKCTQ